MRRGRPRGAAIDLAPPLMRFAMLGSGSKGNGSIVQCGSTTVLVDCGFRASETERRLARLGLLPSAINGILVTHEHGDHLSGVAPLARRYGLPVWMTPGTRSGWREPARDVRLFSPHARFAIGDIEIEPYPVPHDAREPAQYVFGDGKRRLGLLSDAGCVTPHMRLMLSACDALMLECNHDKQMLADGPYPLTLIARVGGSLGHLSNAQAAALLIGIDCTRLQHLALIHISEVNNSPQLARAAVTQALGCDEDWITCADQEQGLGWRALA